MTYVYVCHECGETADVTGGVEARTTTAYCSAGHEMQRSYKAEAAGVATYKLKKQRENGR